jgi:hypothetical protein
MKWKFGRGEERGVSVIGAVRSRLRDRVSERQVGEMSIEASGGVIRSSISVYTARARNLRRQQLIVS